MTPEQKARLELAASPEWAWSPALSTEDLRACLAALDAAEQERDRLSAMLDRGAEQYSECDRERDDLRQRAEQAEATASKLVALEAGYRESERLMLRRLSDALTGGNAGTWEEIAHAAEQAEATLAALTAPPAPPAEAVKVLERISSILGDLDADLSDRVDRAYAMTEAAIRRSMDEADTMAALRAEGEGGDRG